MTTVSDTPTDSKTNARPVTPLTPRQREVLFFIAVQIARTGVAPTHREMCAGLHFSSTFSAHDHLKMLERKGFIALGEHGLARSIKVLKLPEDMPPPVPCCPGCGRPIAGAE